MEDPVQEIPGVIRLLTQSTPSAQRETINTYFTVNASFTHPFCRTGSFDHSRFLIHAIYRWYKIMSPRIDLTVNSVAFDEAHLTLYVNISQVFRIWILPFYRAHVTLVTVLKLQHDRPQGKYYIASQNDMYQTDEWIKFIPFLPFAQLLVRIWHFAVTGICLLLAALLSPKILVEEWTRRSGKLGRRAMGEQQTWSRKKELN